jgi:hypothetical protein
VERDDSILPATRITAAIIIVVLVATVIILYGLPGETERMWAWTITPDMTALYMGAGYAAGAYFFARVFASRSWRSVTLGFLPITSFTVFMLLATILHWDRFNHSHAAFFGWTLLYAVTPVLVPALWHANRRKDPGRVPGELIIPPAARGLLAIAGGLIAVLAVGMMVAPGTVSDSWPWQLTHLTARVCAAYLILTGGSLVFIALDGRWRAAKVLTETWSSGRC